MGYVIHTRHSPEYNLLRLSLFSLFVEIELEWLFSLKMLPTSGLASAVASLLEVSTLAFLILLFYAFIQVKNKLTNKRYCLTTKN